MKVLNLILLLVLYTPGKLPFISTYFLVLNLDGWFGVLRKNLSLFDLPLLFLYINLRSLTNFCLSSGDINLSLVFCFIMLTFDCFWTIIWGSSWGFCNSTVTGLSYRVSSFIASQITVASTVFLISFKCFCCTYFTAYVFIYAFSDIFAHIFRKRQKLGSSLFNS